MSPDTGTGAPADCSHNLLTTMENQTQGESPLSATPCWALPGWRDSYGNVKCSTCGKIQSDHFRVCVECCKHEELELTEEWHGPDEGGGWELDVECKICGKNYDFRRSDLIARYKLVLISPNARAMAQGAPEKPEK